MVGVVGTVGILLNVAATTGVIMSNKALLTRQRFPFVITGLGLNFCTTFGVLDVAARVFGAFQPNTLPPRVRAQLAASAVLTILFNNASVEANSVGTYQISKLLIVPCIIVLERLQNIRHTYTPNMYLALVLVAIGVGITTVTDVELTPRGCVIAACSTVLTAHYQIWQGSKQREHGLNSLQITHTVMLPQIFIALPSALCLDVAWPGLKRLLLLPDRGLFDHEDGTLRILSGPGGPAELAVNLVLNNIFAVAINLSTYYLLAIVSPVTYQIIGQLKTVLIILVGYILFDARPPPGLLLVRCCGAALAIVAVFWYGHLKRRVAAEKAKGS